MWVSLGPLASPKPLVEMNKYWGIGGAVQAETRRLNSGNSREDVDLRHTPGLASCL